LNAGIEEQTCRWQADLSGCKIVTNSAISCFPIIVGYGFIAADAWST
jgi:hypothetical protein